MAKKKITREVENKLTAEQAEEKIKQIETLCKELGGTYFVVADTKNCETNNTFELLHMDGKHDGEKLANFEKNLTMALLNLMPSKVGCDVITQGKADFAYLLTLDVLVNLIRIGASDFAEIEDEVIPGGDTSSWITPEDVEHAIMCEEPASILADEDESDVNEEAVAELEKFLEKVSKQKKGKSFKTRNGEVVEVQGGKLSKEESERLVNTLKELFGDK